MQLNTILRKKGKQIPRSLLTSLTDKQLSVLQRHVSFNSLSPEHQKKYQDLYTVIQQYLPLSDASMTAIFQYRQERRAGTDMEAGNIEERLYKNGGNSYYTPEKCIMVHGSGKVEVIKNTVVPDPDPSIVRPALIPLQTLLSYFLSIKKGEIKSAVSIDAIAERFRSSKMVFKPFGIARIISVLTDAAASIPVLNRIIEEGTTVTSERLVSLIKTILKTCPPEIYYLLHTVVVYEFLNVFHYKVDEVTKEGAFTKTRVGHNKKALVDAKCFHLISKKDVTPDLSLHVCNEVMGQGYPYVALYLGGVETGIDKPVVESIITAIKATSMSAQIKGSEKTALSTMSSMVGYSGVTTEKVKACQRAVAMVGGIISTGIKKIDIELASPAHIELVYHSLMAEFKDYDWMFQVFASSVPNIPKTFRHRVISDRRAGAHFVRYEQADMKAHTTKDKSGDASILAISKENYQSDSYEWKPHDEYSGYTIYTALYGYYPWATTKSVTKSRYFEEFPTPTKEHFVYAFGLADKFYGIVSTVPQLQLFGKQVKSFAKDRVPVLEVAMVPLKHVQTELDWYNRVVQHSCLREVYWSVAKPQYSPISNVIHVPKSGVSFERPEFGAEWIPEPVRPYDDVNDVPEDYTRDDTFEEKGTNGIGDSAPLEFTGSSSSGTQMADGIRDTRLLQKQEQSEERVVKQKQGQSEERVVKQPRDMEKETVSKSKMKKKKQKVVKKDSESSADSEEESFDENGPKLHDLYD